MGAAGPNRQREAYVKKLASSGHIRRASHLISPDALAWVRFGLRATDAPRICDTPKVIYALLKIEAPAGPAWQRYNDNGDGEHDDGSPFDGTGIGRGWPLLTGEPGHFELAGGRVGDARKLLATKEFFATGAGLIREQVGDSPGLRDSDLHFGGPPDAALPEGRIVTFTFDWPEAGHGEGAGFMVRRAAWHREVVRAKEGESGP
ncbi:MAG: hypothetical protein ABI222_07740 [Opitutaceae bacterium]